MEAFTTDKAIASYSVKYRGFKVVVKRDFGGRFFLIDGMPCMWGYVVIDDTGCNVMPGATWFQTVRDAKRGIDNLLRAEDDPVAFWELMRATA